ncbi:MAG TPA: flagellar protein FliT [Gammaproteobacteria bacterium]|nr:flagellar protein FliT [Gammaproteobacteria bacterium]
MHNDQPNPLGGRADARSADEREANARRLLELTREMLDLGRAGEWVSFVERERERQDVAQELFATPVPREAAAVVAECIRRVLDLDHELISLAEAHRDEAAEALKDMRTGAQAANAYRRYSR